MNVMLATRWTGRGYPGWLVSEKLDGVRALWTGAELVSRNGRPIKAPAWLLAELPAGVALDGEIWAGRGSFQAAASAARGGSWEGVTYCVFDAPEAAGGFRERLAVAGAAVSGREHVRSVPHEVCGGSDDMDERLAAVDAAGGEGLVLRQPDAPYLHRRSGAMVKRTTWTTTEVIVTGIDPGTGSLLVGFGGVDFAVSNPAGITAQLGYEITIRFRGLTDSGIPRFAQVVDVRDYE